MEMQRGVGRAEWDTNPTGRAGRERAGGRSGCRGNVGGWSSQGQLGTQGCVRGRIPEIPAGKRSSERLCPAPCRARGQRGHQGPTGWGVLLGDGGMRSALGTEGELPHPTAQRGSGFEDKVSNTV